MAFKLGDYGDPALELAKGIPAAIESYYDARHNKMKELAYEAKVKAEERQKQRQIGEDIIKLEKAGYEIPQGSENPMGLLARGELPKKTGMLGKPDVKSQIDQTRLEILQKKKQGMEKKQEQEQKQQAKGQKLAPDKVLLVQQGAQIPTMLSDIETTLQKNKDIFGPIRGRAGQVNPYDTRAQTVDAQIRAASQAFGRYMEGGVLRKEDEEKYRKMFPQLSDTPEVAANKLAVVNRMLSQKQNADVKALKDQGFDVSAFGEIPEAPVPEIIGGEGKSIFKTDEIEWAD